MFNNADGTDPVTGEEAIELPIDAVRTVQVRESAFAPEFGLSAGAVTTVETERAGDAWHITVNDLEPRPRRRAGEFRGFESWTPRVTVGGPLVTGTINLLESVQYEYSQTRVFGLPAFQSDTKLESFESYTRVDWTVTATNHVTGSVLVSPRKTTYAGLNTFNPQGGTAYTLSAFAVIAIGGLGSYTGALLGALILGLAQSFASYYVGSTLADAAPYVLFIIVMLLVPNGLMGRRTA